MVSDMLEKLEHQITADKQSAKCAAICTRCGSERRPSEYRQDNYYHCHGCGAEWPKLLDNFFWVERFGDLYKETRKSFCL